MIRHRCGFLLGYTISRSISMYEMIVWNKYERKRQPHSISHGSKLPGSLIYNKFIKATIEVVEFPKNDTSVYIWSFTRRVSIAYKFHFGISFYETHIFLLDANLHFDPERWTKGSEQSVKGRLIAPPLEESVRLHRWKLNLINFISQFDNYETEVSSLKMRNSFRYFLVSHRMNSCLYYDSITKFVWAKCRLFLVLKL